VLGGEMIFAFAIALIVGVAIGTYSSIYVAANILMIMNISKEDLIPQEREQLDQDEVPSWLKDEGNEGKEVDEKP
jgi:preprotein translocase subunit SecF